MVLNIQLSCSPAFGLRLAISIPSKGHLRATSVFIRVRELDCVLLRVVPDDLSSFSLLQEHMRVLREEAMALASANMNTVEARESKSSRDNDTSDDKKRKAPKASTGVEKLKKANVKGMAKLSTFFQKK